jgi:hypothetical protein
MAAGTVLLIEHAKDKIKACLFGHPKQAARVLHGLHGRMRTRLECSLVMILTTRKADAYLERKPYVNDDPFEWKITHLCVQFKSSIWCKHHERRWAKWIFSGQENAKMI